MIDKLFICYETLSRFLLDLNAGNIKSTSIIFIEETRLIYTHGIYYATQVDVQSDIQLLRELIGLDGEQQSGQYPQFDLYATYTIGDIVIYDDILYRFTSNKLPSPWNSDIVEKVTIKYLLDNITSLQVWDKILGASQLDLNSYFEGEITTINESIEDINSSITEKELTLLGNIDELDEHLAQLGADTDDRITSLQISLGSKINEVKAEVNGNAIRLVDINADHQKMKFVDSTGTEKAYISLWENVNNDNQFIKYLRFADSNGNQFDQALPALRVNSGILQYTNNGGDSWFDITAVADIRSGIAVKAILDNIPPEELEEDEPTYEVGDLVYALTETDAETYSLYVCTHVTSSESLPDPDSAPQPLYIYTWRPIPTSFSTDAQSVVYTYTNDLNLTVNTNVKAELDELRESIPDNSLWISGTANYSIKQKTNNSNSNIAAGKYSVVEGIQNEISSAGDYSHAEGAKNIILAEYSHAEGFENVVDNECSHVEGIKNTVHSKRSHAEGSNNLINSHANDSHVEGESNVVRGGNSHAEGHFTTSGISSGEDDDDRADDTHTQGYATAALEMAAHAEGGYSMDPGYTLDSVTPNRDEKIAINISAVSDPDSLEVASTTTCWFLINSISDFYGVSLDEASYPDYVKKQLIGKKVIYAQTDTDHENPLNILIVDAASRSIGGNNVFYIETELPLSEESVIDDQVFYICGNSAYGCNSHAEGNFNTVEGRNSHVEGSYNIILSTANNSHVEGIGNIANSANSHVSGSYNMPTIRLKFCVGVGSDDTSRKNAIEILHDGSSSHTSSFYIEGVGGYNGRNASESTTLDLVSAILQFDVVSNGDITSDTDIIDINQ